MRLLALAAVAGLAVAGLVASGVPALWELPLRDAALRRFHAHRATHVAVVAVDEAALDARGPWPWPRALLARLVLDVHRAGARAVAVDLLLTEERPGDAELAAALGSLPSLLAAALDDSGTRWVLPAPSLRRASRLSHASLELDQDGVLRRLSSTKQAEGVALPALAPAAAALATGRPVSVAREVRPAFAVRPTDVPTVGAAALLDGSADLALLRGRVVFIGATALGIGDRAVTPTSSRRRPVPGVLVQAAVCEDLIAGRTLHAVPAAVAGLAAAVLVGLAGLLPHTGGGRRAAAGALLATSPAAAGLLALRWAHLEAPFATLTAVAVLGVLAVETRLAWLTHRGAGAAADLLGRGLGGPSGVPSSPEERLRRLEETARSFDTRRTVERDARRVMAHELKTPLTSVRGLTQLLAGFELSPEETRRVVAMVGRETERLRVMIDGLLDIERVAARRFDDDARPVDLSGLTASRCAPLAAGTGRTIGQDLAPGVMVAGDPALLERVVDNLVGNALKHGGPGAAVTVSVRGRGGEAVLEVTDDGPGIPAEEQRSVFARFSRGAAASGREGLGLGLALVDEVVTWHEGRVELDSVPGRGCVFRVVLPLLAAPSRGGP